MNDFEIKRYVEKMKMRGGPTNEDNAMLLEKMAQLKRQGVKDEDNFYRTILIFANTGLIIYIANNFSKSSYTSQDEELFSDGMLGLIKAIDNYSTEKGVKFSSFATTVIINEIRMRLRKEASLTCRALNDYISFEDCIPFRDANHDRTLSLEEVVPSDENIQEDVTDKLLFEHAISLMNKFTPKQQTVLVHLYGLFGYPVLVQEEIGKILGLTRSSVSRIVMDIKRKFRVLLSPYDTLSEADKKLFNNIKNQTYPYIDEVKEYFDSNNHEV